MVNIDDEDKYNLRFFVIIIVLVFLVVFVTLVVVFSKTDNIDMDGYVSLNNIELVNVSPYDCWNEDFNNEFCPVPHDITLTGRFDFPINPRILVSMLNGIGNLR